MPHLLIVRSQRGGALEIEESVMMHFKDFVCLPEAIPGAVVFAVDVDGSSVGFNGRMRVLHLNILMAHKSPGGEEIAVQGQRTPEIHDCFFVLGFERVVVADDAACFGTELVGGGGQLGEKGELWTI